MRKTIKDFFSKYWHTMMLIFMFLINSLEIYAKRNEPEFKTILADNIVLMIWVATWYMSHLLYKRAEARADAEQESGDLYRTEYLRLYNLIKEHNRRVDSKDDKVNTL